MKKLLLTIGLVASVSLAYGQGTIRLSNLATYKLSSSVQGTLTVIPVTPNAISFSLYYGAAADSLSLLTGLTAVNCTTTSGLIASADGSTLLTLVGIPGFGPNTQPYLQIRAVSTDGKYEAVSPVKQAPLLGAAAGPAVSIWQSNTGTNPNLFKPNDLILMPVPEPSTLALAGLGVASLLIFRRRK